ncbi:MAG: hypothetical protein JWP14_2074 [Frankiales bacterium]|nr:hypothetical protein [Frankiales bacterium]
MLGLAFAAVLASGFGTFALEMLRTRRSGASVWKMLIEFKQRQAEWALYFIGLALVLVAVVSMKQPWVLFLAPPLYVLVFAYLRWRPVGPVRRAELPDFDS